MYLCDYFRKKLINFSIYSMCSNINTRAIHPIKRKNFWFRFSPEYPQYARALKTLQDFTYGVCTDEKK